MNLSKLNRKELAAIVKSNNIIIERCNKQNLEVLQASWLLCDKRQQFKEEMETRGRSKKKVTELIGRIHWKDTFTDSGTGEKFKIERSRVVRINGEWI